MAAARLSRCSPPAGGCTHFNVSPNPPLARVGARSLSVNKRSRPRSPRGRGSFLPILRNVYSSFLSPTSSGFWG
eukprot:scaffold321376_cov21-Tisochrysis_lutea.AAC.1